MTITIATGSGKAVVDITQAVADKLSIKDGLVHVFAMHTTVGLAVADMDSGADEDYMQAIENIIPKISYRHPHDPDHMPDHVASVLVDSSLTVPVEQGELQLGTWQRLVLFEFDGPRQRKLVITQISSV